MDAYCLHTQYTALLLPSRRAYVTFHSIKQNSRHLFNRTFKLDYNNIFASEYAADKSYAFSRCFGIRIIAGAKANNSIKRETFICFTNFLHSNRNAA